jgi:two-component system, NtrC family, response regulator AtoC
MIKHHLVPIENSTQTEILSNDIKRTRDDEFFVCASPLMRKLRSQADLLSQTDAPLLILGEPGTGKATVARLIHDASIRSGFQFIKVKCGALPEELLEIEFFGSELISPGGTIRRRQGVFEVCEKGTVLLEDIDELPANLQTKIQQVLENRRFSRSNSHERVHVDARILATVSGNVERALSEKKLREDLYYHLSAYTMQVPPLRQRKEEIALLLHHFMQRLAKHYGLPASTFSQVTQDACQAYCWPGNLRELEDFVKRCLVLGDKDPRHADPQPGSSNRLGAAKSTNGESEGLSPTESSRVLSLKSLLQTVKSEAERNAIVNALEKTGWNRKAAARLLKVSYRTMLYKIEQYHMTSPDHSSEQMFKNGMNGLGHGLKDSRQHS